MEWHRSVYQTRCSPICYWCKFSRLLKHQRREQSGFTNGRSITDHILVLRLLVECQHEFQQWMLAAYVGFKKTFHLLSTLGSSAPFWDSCRDYWPILRDWKCCEASFLWIRKWGRNAFLLHHFSTNVWTGYWAELWTKVTVEHLLAIPRSLILVLLMMQ